MRFRPTAFAWIDLEVSTAPAWDRAQVQRLARSLGFVLLWPEPSLIPLADQVAEADVDALITPSPAHLSALTLNALMRFTDVETVSPRLSFERWSFGKRLV